MANNKKYGEQQQLQSQSQQQSSPPSTLQHHHQQQHNQPQPQQQQRSVAFTSRLQANEKSDESQLVRSIRSGSVDDSLIYENKANVYDYLQNSFNSSAGPIVRSNSFTHQDIGRHRKTIQASFASGLVTNEEDEDLLHQKGRRLSKSLPELNQFRLLPQFAEAANHYNVIFESDQDDDEEDNTSSCIATETEYHPAWSTKSDFFLTVMGFSLALNTIWRFPYFCYINDGGSFLTAYTFLMLVCGLPLLCMEYAIGQLTHRNLFVFAHLCPLLKGIVVSLALTTSILIPLYSGVNTWSMLYFFKSFHQIPPWSRCTNKWNVEPCLSMEKSLASGHDIHHPTIDNYTIEGYFNESSGDSGIADNGSSISADLDPGQPQNLMEDLIGASKIQLAAQYASQQFFDNRLLHIDLNSHLLGIVRWDLAMILFFIWLIIFFALRKSYVFSSNPTFCLAIVPTMVFGILFFKAIFLKNARKGLVFFFKPTWEGISQPYVWLYAAGFTLHSLGNVTGLSLGLAKCQRDRNNLMRDAILACLINYISVLIVGCIIFSTVGHLAYERGLEIAQVVVRDPGLAYVVLSELLASMPMRTLWSCLFFFLLFCLGIDYQIAIVATVIDCVKDIWRACTGRRISHQLVVFCLSVIFFSLSLFFITQKGIVLVRITEHYITVLLTVMLALLEILLVGNFYGTRNLVNAIRLVTCKAPGSYFSFCWNLFTALSLLIILALNTYYFEEFTFRDLKDSFMVDLLGPVMVLIALLPIPCLAFHELRRKGRSDAGFFQRLSLAFKPEGDPIYNMKQGNTGGKTQNSDGNNTSDNLSDDITAPVMSYSMIQGLDRETTI